MRLKLFFALGLLAAAVFSVSAGSKYCKNYKDFTNNVWTDLDSAKITFELRSGSSKYWTGGADFDIKTGQKSLDKKISKSRFFSYNDTLYVNCRGLRHEGVVLGNGFAPGFSFDGGKKVVFAIDRNEDGGLFVTIAEAVRNTLSPGAASKDCYVIVSKSNVVEKLTPFYLEQLLKQYPEQLNRYMCLSDADRKNYMIVMQILKEIK